MDASPSIVNCSSGSGNGNGSGSSTPGFSVLLIGLVVVVVLHIVITFTNCLVYMIHSASKSFMGLVSPSILIILGSKPQFSPK